MNLKETANFLKNQHRKVLLLAHHNADPDSVCSALALSEGLKQLNCKTTVGVAEGASRLSNRVLAELGETVEENPKLDFDLIILLDTSTPGQLSSFLEEFEKSNTKKLIIDHHSVQEKRIETEYAFVDANSTSTCKLVYDILMELNLNIEKKSAVALICGMVADTAHLKFADLGDLKIIVELLEKQDMKFGYILSILRLKPDISESIARLKAAKRAEVHRIKDFLIVTSRVKSFEASSARALIHIGADLAAVLAERENEIRISLRSKQTFYDKTKIHLGNDIMPELSKIIDGSGSGHPTAAGANGKNLENKEKALEYIVNYVKENLK